MPNEDAVPTRALEEGQADPPHRICDRERCNGERVEGVRGPTLSFKPELKCCRAVASRRWVGDRAPSSVGLSKGVVGCLS